MLKTPHLSEKRSACWKAEGSAFIGGERGFSLIEVLVAVAIIGTVMVGTIVVVGSTANTSSETATAVELQQIARSQLELIHHSTFQANPADYPKLTNLPVGVTLATAVTDPGISYTYPLPDGAVVTGMVQQVTVTASNGEMSADLSFYKIKSP
jgi:prepilin-type N-terminal cleavage/methylation domain-containing protein